MATPTTYLWNNNGTKQSDRLPKALSGDYVKIDERSFDDLMAQIAEYAKRLDYFDVIDEEIVKNGDWTDFFRDVYDYEKHELKKERIEALIEEGDIPPHMALIMAFLKMYEVEQANLNTLTEKHLQFYYKDILGFKPREGENGKATVFFEPVKNAPETFIPKGTLFDAGKDANGKPITYRSVRDVTVNQTKVTETKRLPIKGVENASFGLIVTHPSIALLENEEKELVSSYTASEGKLDISFGKDNIVIVVKASENLTVLSNLLSSKLSIKVTNSKNFVMENAQGALANQTGTMPFGSQPQKGDFFTISVPQFGGCTLNDAQVKWNSDSQIKGSDITKENNSKFTLKKGLDWSSYNSGLKKYTDYLKGSSNDAASMPQPPKAPSLAEPITINYTISLEGCQIQCFSPLGTQTLLEKAKQELNQMQTKHSLCLKLEGLQKACVLTLHFEMNPFKYKINGKYGNNAPKWYYHTSDGWTAFADTDIISDTTDRFHNSGIAQLKITDAIAASAKDTEGEFWLMVNGNPIDENTSKKYVITPDDPFDALEAVRAQAVEVELDPNSEGQIETGATLPMGSITKAKTSIKGIKKIEQPYNGEEGRRNETDETFNTRVSEELRHKGRAWNRWDYEHLVLERFPQISNAKCLSGCNTNGNLEAGCVTLLVIPDGQAILQPNPLKPIIGQTLKDEIVSYLQKRASNFVTITVKTPDYKEAKVTCDFVLRKDYTDVNHYRDLLNEQLKAYLAPWSSGDENMAFRTDKNESQVEEFIENQYYVDYIESFSLSIDGVPVKQGEPLQPEGAFTIVTSDKDHVITPKLPNYE